MINYLPETPSQTAGPYVHIGLIPHQAGFDIFEKPFGNVVADRNTTGERIRIEGRVLDGLGAPCRDILLEIWQANAAGRYNHPADQQRDKPLDAGFRGWGRAGTDFETGLYRFDTIKPGPVIGRRGYKPMAPHVNFWLAARGINIGLATRMYFDDEATLNEQDPVLRIIEPAIRRQTLLARREMRDGGIPGLRGIPGISRAGLAGGGAQNQNDTQIPQENGYITYVFDIRLQGDQETVFFDV